MVVLAGLTVSTPYLWVTDKFGNQYSAQVTVADDGSFVIDPSQFPEGMFNEHAGAFDLFLSSDEEGSTILDVFGDFQCILLTLICDPMAVKKYVALVSQSGTDAPTVVVLENTIGTITWGYISDGDYSINSSGLFTLNKTIIFMGAASQDTDAGIFLSEQADANQLHIRTMDFDSGPPAGFTVQNGKLVATSIEIRVYP